MAGSGLTGFLQNFGGGEILLIVLAALVVLGPERLPDAARSIGKGLHRLRTMTSGLQSQVQDVIDDPAMQSIRELGEFAARPRQKLAEYALEAEAEARSQAEQAERSAPADAPSAEENATNERVAGDTATAEPATDEPATDGPITDEPVSDSASSSAVEPGAG